MDEAPTDQLLTRAPGGIERVVANPHVVVDNDFALGTFLLHVLADAIGMRIAVFMDATRMERAAVRKFHPRVFKYSGVILVSAERVVQVAARQASRARATLRRQAGGARAPRERVSRPVDFRSVEPRDALCARSTATETDGQRRRDARDAERRKPGGRTRRENAWAQSRHRRSRDAQQAIRDVSRKMRDTLLHDNMGVCDVCDEEEFASNAEFREVRLTDELRVAWMREIQTDHGHGTRSKTPETVRACKACAKVMAKNMFPWNWKMFAPLLPVPEEVNGLNDLEYSLIAPTQCTAIVYVANAGAAAHVPESATNGTCQSVSKYNSFLLKHYVDAAIRVVPRLLEDCGVVFVKRCDSARNDAVFPIRVERTIAALRVLLRDNPDA